MAGGAGGARRAPHRWFDVPGRLAAMFIESRANRMLAAGAPQLAVYAHDHIGKVIVLNGAFEYEELEALAAWLGDDHAHRTMLDVGANIGNHAVRLARHFARVRAFEPNPRAFALLEVNAELGGNIVCHAFGLSSANRPALIKFNARNLGGAALTEAPGDLEPGETQMTVELRTLDSCVGPTEDIGLIKIDVEDHEREVLLGARETIARCRPVIVFEQHFAGVKGGTSEVVELLRGYGYHDFRYIDRTPRFDEVVSFLWQCAFGYRFALIPLKRLARRNYKMIVALA